LTRRVVLLGASNLTRSLATVLAIAYRMWGGPFDVLAACGLGRSYGLRMPFLWRELPGIVECGLWQAWARRPPAPTVALLTDIGNDLLYDVPVPKVVSWVETCLDRFVRAEARVVLTPLPLCSVANLSQTRFLIMRTLLFPGCRLPYATIMQRAIDLDQCLRSLAQTRGAMLVEHRPEWYGFDPIHIRRQHRQAAWAEFLAPLEAPAFQPGGEPGRAGDLDLPAHLLLRGRLHLGLLRPERQWIFGRERQKAQPCRQWADGTTLSLY
jgi:hypothetical protein